MPLPNGLGCLFLVPFRFWGGGGRGSFFLSRAVAAGGEGEGEGGSYNTREWLAIQSLVLAIISWYPHGQRQRSILFFSHGVKYYVPPLVICVWRYV